MSRPEQRIAPVDGALYVVRWVRLDGRVVKHRYFRRRHDAKAFQLKLHKVSREARLYKTAATWQETEA